MRLGKTPEFVGVGPEKLIGIMSNWNENIFRKLWNYLYFDVCVWETNKFEVLWSSQNI